MSRDEISELEFYRVFYKSYIQYLKGDWKYKNRNPEFGNQKQIGIRTDMSKKCGYE